MTNSCTICLKCLTVTDKRRRLSASYSVAHTHTHIDVCLVPERPWLYRGRVPRLTSNNFTCCHTRDRAEGGRGKLMCLRKKINIDIDVLRLFSKPPVLNPIPLQPFPQPNHTFRPNYKFSSHITPLPSYPI